MINGQPSVIRSAADNDDRIHRDTVLLHLWQNRSTPDISRDSERHIDPPPGFDQQRIERRSPEMIRPRNDGGQREVLTRCPASIGYGLVTQDIADELAEVLLRVTGRGSAVDQ
jgi:hypothetical protein